MTAAITTSFTLNGNTVSVEATPDTPLLWVLRDHLQMTGTKFGCGAGLCGACSVILDGNSTRSCVLPLSAVAGRDVLTIEGLGDNHPVQTAWIEQSVPQCGYCQSGQIMSAVALLESNAAPSDDEIKSAMAGNICRCGAYSRIFAAIKSLLDQSSAGDGMGLFYDASQAADRELQS